MNLISIILATAFFVLLVRACFETVWGLMLATCGLCLMLVSWLLGATAWSLKRITKLWKTAFP